MSTTKIFVGKLSYDTTDQGLNDFFAPYGEVTSAVVIIDRATNKSKGFGFVEMSDLKSAQKAIAELNDKELDGRTVVVNAAKPRENKPRNQAGFRRSW